MDELSGLNSPKIIVKPPGPKVRELLKMAGLSPTQYFQPIMEEAGGIFIKDPDGNIFIDFISGRCVTNVGYSHPKVVEALQRQVARGLHGITEARLRLNTMLSEVTPGDFPKCVYYGQSGSAMNDLGIKAARWSTKRPYIVAFTGAYHGVTYGALSVSSYRPYMIKGFYPNLPGIFHFPYPYCYRCPLEYPKCGIWCASFIEDLIDLHTTKEVAGVLLEPVLGEGGIIVPPKEYLPEIRKICTKNAIPLIIDEVQTGAGRTGRMFACEHYNVSPDIMVMGKGVGGGMPLSAVLATDKIAAAWEPGDHTHTFSGNPVCCAAGIATLEVLADEKLPENASKVGDHIIQNMNPMKEKYDVIGEIRSLGLMIGVELVKDRAKKTPAVEEAAKVKSLMQEQGILIGLGGWKKNVLRIQPPLILSIKEADRLIDALDKSLKQL